MKTLMMVAVAAGSMMMANGSAMANSAFAERKAVSINLCTNSVAKRTGNSDIRVYRSESVYNSLTVWMEVGGGHTFQFKCKVVKNGPNNYYIQSVRQL